MNMHRATHQPIK